MTSSPYSIEAARYDRGMWLVEKMGITALRKQLLKDVTGEVLEIGAGTGVNFTLYGPEVHLTAIDLRENSLRAAASKVAAAYPRLERSVLLSNAEDLPFSKGQFDVVVGTLVFCSITNPEAALREICRVLRPNGSLFLLEHVRGQTRAARLFTDVLHPIWFAMQGECHLNRETADTVTLAGFRIDDISVHGKGLLQMIRATAPSTY